MNDQDIHKQIQDLAAKVNSLSSGSSSATSTGDAKTISNPDPSLETPSIDNSRIDFLWSVHSYLNHYISFADSKAGFISVLSSSLFVAAYTTGLTKDLLAPTSCRLPCFSIFVIISLIALLVSLLGCGFCVLPRLPKNTPRGIIFWEEVLAHGNKDAYFASLNASDWGALERSVSDHIFILSKICRTKYRMIRLALLSLIFGGLLSGILIALKQF